MLVVGPNGAGKTNLLEALHLAGQGFSPRTRSDADLIRFGETAGRVALAARSDGAPFDVELILRAGEAKRARVNGAPLAAAEQLRTRAAVLVFTPDRLAIVKGGPAVRRAYFDRALGRLSPARATLPAEYAAAVGQRNAALRRVGLGFSSREALAPWTQRVADLGGQLVQTRVQTVTALAPGFGEHMDALGLEPGRLVYTGEPPTREQLEGRLERDLERGTTGLGPHLDDVGILAGRRDLRVFGSQGEQRLAVLSLLLAEAELLRERRSLTPLLLLDDVLSELDAERRRHLVERLGSGAQALVSATEASALAAEPAQLVEVAPGVARAVGRGG